MTIHQNTNSGCAKIILYNIAAPVIAADAFILQLISLSMRISYILNCVGTLS